MRDKSGDGPRSLFSVASSRSVSSLAFAGASLASKAMCAPQLRPSVGLAPEKPLNRRAGDGSAAKRSNKLLCGLRLCSDCLATSCCPSAVLVLPYLSLHYVDGSRAARRPSGSTNWYQRFWPRISVTNRRWHYQKDTLVLSPVLYQYSNAPAGTYTATAPPLGGFR